MTEPFALSYSKLHLYRRCPRAFKLRYIDHINLTREDDRYLKLGRAVHVWVEKLLREGNATDPRAYSDATGTPLLPPELSGEWPALRDRILQLLEDWRWTLEQHLVGVEETMRYPWTDTARQRDVVMTVKLDALVIDGSWAWNIDWKTGWGIPDRDEMQTDLQLMMGALAIRRAYPRVTHVQGTLVPLRYPRRQPVLVDFTADVIDAFEQQLRAEVSMMMGDTEFKPAPWCEVCPPGVHANALRPFRDVQLDFKNDAYRVDLGPIEEPGHALQVAQGVKIAERLVRAGEERLKEWTDRNGPVQLGAGAFGHWEQTTTKLDNIEEVIEVAQQRDIPLSDLLAFNMRKGKKYLVGKGAVPALALLAEITTKTQFDWKADAEKARPKPQQPNIEVIDIGHGSDVQDGKRAGKRGRNAQAGREHGEGAEQANAVADDSGADRGGAMKHYARAYKNPDDAQASYAFTHGNLLAGPKVDCSIYRMQQSGVDVVAVMGADADEGMLQGGDPYTLPENVLGYLMERRAQMSALGLATGTDGVEVAHPKAGTAINTAEPDA